jgi:hypothetical protein
MYAQTETIAPSSPSFAVRLAARRAALQTRPPIQRVLVRSWEYIPPVRVAILGIRMAVTGWLVFLGAMLLASNIGWGWALFPAAAVVAAISIWVFVTAAKGWPGVEA